MSDMPWDQPVQMFDFNKNVISVYKLCVMWNSWDYIFVHSSMDLVR